MRGQAGRVPTHSVGPQLFLVEEAPSHHLLAEGHHVRWVIQAPVLMGPELASAASSSLDLVHQEGTAVLVEVRLGRDEHRVHPPTSDPDPRIQPKSHCFLNLTPSPYSQAVQNQTKA